MRAQDILQIQFLQHPKTTQKDGVWNIQMSFFEALYFVESAVAEHSIPPPPVQAK